MNFLKYFPKNKNGMYVIYELYSFDNFFKLLLKNSFSHDEAINFIMSQCSVSGIVFQERIHNKYFLKISRKNILRPKEASVKARLLYDIMDCYNSLNKRWSSLI